MSNGYFCFPGDDLLPPSPASQLFRYRVLYRTAAGYLSFTSIHARKAIPKSHLDTVAEQLSRVLSQEPLAANLSEILTGVVGMGVTVEDAPFLDAGNWGTASALNASIARLAARASHEGLPKQRERIADQLQACLAQGITKFESNLDREVLELVGPAALTSAAYNYLVADDPVVQRNRRQAARVFPLILRPEVFGPEWRTHLGRIRRTIDEGKPLHASLAAELSVPPSVVKTLATLPIGVAQERWRGRVASLLRLLKHIPPEHRPKDCAGWQLFSQMTGDIESITGVGITHPLAVAWVRLALKRNGKVLALGGIELAALGPALTALSDALQQVLTVQVQQHTTGPLDTRAVQRHAAAVVQEALASQSLDRLSTIVRKWHDSQRRCEKRWNVATAHFEMGRWPAPQEEFRTTERTITPILNARDLNAEGDAMRHCVSTYASPCSKGKVQVWSIRDTHGVRTSTLATGFRYDHAGCREAVILEHRGVANAPPDPNSVQAAQLFVAVLTRNAARYTEYWAWSQQIAPLAAAERQSLRRTMMFTETLEATLPAPICIAKLVHRVAQRIDNVAGLADASPRPR